MAKRHAAEALEGAIYADSPSPKKARADSVSDEDSGPPPNSADAANPSSAAADADGEQSAYAPVKRQAAPSAGYADLYLDTVDRSALDFDFEKLCSVSLANVNVYACLVCGRYFQGRGPSSHAYFHALEVGHHVFINMETRKIYVLPEGYEVKSGSMEDIKFVVDPRLSKEEVMKLDKEGGESWDLGGKKYRPGYIGMNNIRNNDYFNVIIQVLAHVPPIRNYFMLEDFSGKPELVQRFSTLVRKIWNTRAFKTHVSPHELGQQVTRQSQKKFDLLNQSDPTDFLSWFLNNLHLALGGSKTKPGSSIIHKVFQGKLKVESQDISTSKAEDGSTDKKPRFEESSQIRTDITRYLMLTLDLPPAPLFKDELDRNIIPQVPLTSLLGKYDGLRTAEHTASRKRYRLLHPLPPFLLLHVKRFSANQFAGASEAGQHEQRNPTIVTFQPRHLDLAPFVEPNPALHPHGEPVWYDLAANVTHEAVKAREDSVEGEVERKVWRVQLRDRARGDEWLEIQDLFVEKVPTETLFTKESYLMVWERRKDGKKKAK